MYSENDLNLMKKKGISEETIQAQLDRFKTGFPFLKIDSAATVGKGIVKLSEIEERECVTVWDNYLANGGDVEKFVPASGAASRMFKNLFEFIEKVDNIPTSDFEKKFFAEITKFAFYKSLDNKCVEVMGKSIAELVAEGKYVDVVKMLILPEGLNYGSLPKAVLQFHKDGECVKTALEEHLEEGVQYALNNGTVKVHFTVSPEHRAEFEKIISVEIPKLEALHGVKYIVEMSEQKSSTDTIAVNMDNTPFRDKGELLFRPAGHGALIENLNELAAEVVFIKNIDNVVPNKLREATIKYKKVIGGYLVKTQQQIKEYITLLESGKYSIEDVREVIKFVQTDLSIRNVDTKHMEDVELVLYLLKKMKRPIRICGVVKNDGEPGGGPYIAFNEDGTSSCQILESSQFDMSKSESAELISGASHFNPVDLVCFIKDVKDDKFNLKEYVDVNTGFISEKSKSGKALKALELPGLWNGAMSDWNTIFVEVPIETFNPVKTVNDLLRPQHQ